MKLTYVHNADFSYPNANKHQVMNMCNAFAKNGVEVTLLTFASDKKKLKNYKFNKVKTVFLKPKFNYYFRTLQLLNHSKKITTDIFYTRDLFFANKKKCVYELHELPESKTWNYLFKKSRFRKLVVISKGIYDKLSKEKKKIAIISKDSYEPKKITTKKSKNKLIVYVGNTDEAHDMKTFIAAAKKLPKINFEIYGKNQEFFKELPKNVTYKGYTHTPELAYGKAHALYAGYTNRVRHIEYMSPLKMFEYLAAKRPVIVAEFPRTKEVTKNAIFYKSGNVKSLLTAFQNALKPNKTMVESAYDEVKNNTWEKRAKTLLQNF